MPFEYLADGDWRGLTRDERYFCVELFCASKSLPSRTAFLQFVIERCGLAYDAVTVEAEVAVELHFYRDIKHAFENVQGDYSDARTFDLAIFFPHDIVIIEAKIDQGYLNEQLQFFQQDRENVQAIIHEINPEAEVNVHLIGLACGGYWDSCRETTREAFDQVISWHELPLPQEVLDRIAAIGGEHGW